MEAGLGLGKKTEEVVVNLTEKIKNLYSKARFLMPPQAVDEFLSFFEDKNQEFLKEFLSVITIKSVDLGKINFSSQVFAKLIQDVRQRSYRGLNIAEEEIENAALEFAGAKLENKKDFQIKIGKFINRFRERYRKATRFGFLDSLTDFLLIALAYQEEAFLVSTDEGVLRWSQEFAVKQMPALVFAKRLEFLLLPHQG
ncbi:MAG: RNA ligase partner protein [Microgenomates group bacterium]